MVDDHIVRRSALVFTALALASFAAGCGGGRSATHKAATPSLAPGCKVYREGTSEYVLVHDDRVAPATDCRELSARWSLFSNSFWSLYRGSAPISSDVRVCAMVWTGVEIDVYDAANAQRLGDHTCQEMAARGWAQTG